MNKNTNYENAKNYCEKIFENIFFNPELIAKGFVEKGIIFPRAKVGDVVYTLCEDMKNSICENEVVIVSYDENGIYYQFKNTGMAYESECYFSVKEAKKHIKKINQ